MTSAQSTQSSENSWHDTQNVGMKPRFHGKVTIRLCQTTKEVSLQRLSNLQNRRQRLDVTESYGEIIKNADVLGNSGSRK